MDKSISTTQLMLSSKDNKCSIFTTNVTNKQSIEDYIKTVIEVKESIEKYNELKLKPSLKYIKYNDEEWEEVKAIVATSDISKVHCIQSTYSYEFYIYNSPKHGLLEITKSNWNGNITSVISISYDYLVSNFRPNEIKMTFNCHLIEIVFNYDDNFITNPSLKMTDTIRVLVNSKKDEITHFYTSKSKSESEFEFESMIFQNPEKYMRNLYINLGIIDKVQYFVTKSRIYMNNYDDKEYLVLFAQLDENNFVSTHLEVSE